MIPFRRSYPRIFNCPKIKGVILDWCGTTVDPYSLSPALAMKELFENHNIYISLNETRGPMGTDKYNHIETLLSDGNIQRQWIKHYGRPSIPADVKKMYDEYIPIQKYILEATGRLIPGIGASLRQIQNNNIKIGHTTGFTRDIVEVILKNLTKKEYYPDSYVAFDDVEYGSRPYPNMIYKNMDLLGIDDIKSVIKVDDTTAGIYEGHNAGCWTVGVYKYSNYMEIESPESDALMLTTETPILLNNKTHVAIQKLKEAQPHYIIDTIQQLPEIIEEINERLLKNESP